MMLPLLLRAAAAAAAAKAAAAVVCSASTDGLYNAAATWGGAVPGALKHF